MQRFSRHFDDHLIRNVAHGERINLIRESAWFSSHAPRGFANLRHDTRITRARQLTG